MDKIEDDVIDEIKIKEDAIDEIAWEKKQIKKLFPKKNMVYPEMCGQLWQECERCGREPVYLPLELCEDCWPKG